MERGNSEVCVGIGEERGRREVCTLYRGREKMSVCVCVCGGGGGGAMVAV